MRIYASIYDNRHGRTYDISEAIGNIQITTYIRDNPGKCTFDIVRSNGIAFWEGATVSIVVDGVNMFKGFVFSKKRNEDVDIITCTCYDQLRYLKNKDAYVFEGMTSDQIFSFVCGEFVLKSRVVDPSPYVCAPRSNDAVALYEMIQKALDDTLVNTGRWYFIRDNFGVLEHVNIFSCNTGVVLGDRSGVSGFSYETSIDGDTYNQVKLYRDNTTTGKREIYIVNDTISGGKNLKEWGILQLYEKVDDNLNKAQIEAKGLGMLKLYNAVTRKLKLNVLGIPNMFAGCVFRCLIADIGDLSVDKYLLVTECVHNISSEEHTMELTTEVVSK